MLQLFQHLGRADLSCTVEHPKVPLYMSELALLQDKDLVTIPQGKDLVISAQRVALLQDKDLVTFLQGKDLVTSLQGKDLVISVQRVQAPQQVSQQASHQHSARPLHRAEQNPHRK